MPIESLFQVANASPKAKQAEVRMHSAQLAKVLPNLAIPKHFVVMEELPKMGSGKIDFRKVQELVIEKLNFKN